MQHTILVENLSKQFCRYHANRPVTFHEAVLQGLRRIKPVEKFWALQDVSFEIAPGRMVGLIGRNGSGKSTLLSLIGGIGKPDRGRIKTHGRIRALLDLGVGLHPDLTGRENVFISGVIAGLTRREVQRQFDSIVAFAELEPFIDNSLRTYSTGMRMRLGFAIAIHTFPEILLVDEVLAVGDVAFQKKCIEQIKQFKEAGCTILFVSHDETQVKRLCDDVAYLNKGKLVAYGEPEVVISRYLTDMQRQSYKRQTLGGVGTPSSQSDQLKLNQNRFGSLEAEITEVRFCNAEGLTIDQLRSGDALNIEIFYHCSHTIDSPIFGVTITNEEKTVCYDTTTAATGEIIPSIRDSGKVTLHLERLDLSSGMYYVNIGIYEANGTYIYDYHWQVYCLIIHSENTLEKGILQPPRSWSMDIENSQKYVYSRKKSEP
jgi:lipopolysaccharide transport system ATP-binding protein